MNLDKMRRNLARNVPDAVWKDFDRDYSLSVGIDNTREFIEWRDWFGRMMKLKHGDKGTIMNVSVADILDTDKVRVQIVCRPMTIKDLKDQFDRGVMTANQIRGVFGQGPRYG